MYTAKNLHAAIFHAAAAGTGNTDARNPPPESADLQKGARSAAQALPPETAWGYQTTAAEKCGSFDFLHLFEKAAFSQTVLFPCKFSLKDDFYR